MGKKEAARYRAASDLIFQTLISGGWESGVAVALVVTLEYDRCILSEDATRDPGRRLRRRHPEPGGDPRHRARPGPRPAARSDPHLDPSPTLARAARPQPDLAHRRQRCSTRPGPPGRHPDDRRPGAHPDRQYRPGNGLCHRRSPGGPVCQRPVAVTGHGGAVDAELATAGRAP